MGMPESGEIAKAFHMTLNLRILSIFCLKKRV